MRKTKPNSKPNTRQLARMLAADTSLTEGEKVNLARALAGAPLPREDKSSEMPDWLASHFAAHDADRAQQATRLRRRRYLALYVALMLALLLTGTLVWAVMMWGSL